MAIIRLDSDERRKAIVRAAVPIFARKGFAGTTTRELAEAAGISEALLFKHFPSKQSLYREIRQLGCEGDPALETLATLPPSTATLVWMLRFMVRHFLSAAPFERLVVEVRYIAAFRPTDAALQSLQSFLNARLNKPGGVEVLAGYDGEDAGQLQRRLGRNVGDLGVREGAAHDVHVEHAGERDVVDVIALAAQEAGVFLALDALAVAADFWLGGGCHVVEPFLLVGAVTRVIPRDEESRPSGESPFQ